MNESKKQAQNEKVEKIKPEDIKLEDLKIEKFSKDDVDYFFQIWHHHDSMFWNRFNVFIQFVAIGIAVITGLIFVLIDSNNNIYLILISIISAGILVIGLSFHSLLRRTYSYITIAVRLGLQAQKVKEVNPFLTDEIRKTIDFGFLGNRTSFGVVKFILISGHILFFVLSLLSFFFYLYPSYFPLISL